MGEPGWYPPEVAKAHGMVRVHNGIGWGWCAKDFAATYSAQTASARAAGDIPPEERAHVSGQWIYGCGCEPCRLLRWPPNGERP